MYDDYRAEREWDEACERAEEFEQQKMEAERYLTKQYGKAWGYRDGMLVFNEDACDRCKVCEENGCDGCCNILCDLGTWGENYFSDEVQEAIIEAIDSGEV